MRIVIIGGAGKIPVYPNLVLIEGEYPLGDTLLHLAAALAVVLKQGCDKYEPSTEEGKISSSDPIHVILSIGEFLRSFQEYAAEEQKSIPSWREKNVAAAKRVSEEALEKLRPIAAELLKKGGRKLGREMASRLHDVNPSIEYPFPVGGE